MLIEPSPINLIYISIWHILLAIPETMKRFSWLELALIGFIGGLYFCLLAPVQTTNNFDQPDGLNLEPLTRLIVDSATRPDALEHERLTGSILPIKIGLEHDGRVPFWNPYLSNGLPLLNNPFNYLFNPFHSLPILLLGGVQGSKLALFITLLISAYSMWALGYAIGLGSLARVAMAVLYMVNGSLIAKFGAGHFQLANSLAWPPLVFACLWWTLHSKNRFAPLAVGTAFALLFYAGNIYYVLHTLVCCAVMIATQIVVRHNGRWRLASDRLGRIVMVGLLAFGLSAAQFFPIWQTRDFVTHQRQIINTDGTLQASYDLKQSFINLTTPWSQWTSLQQPELTGLFGAVDYAYVGTFLFMLITIGVALAVLRPGWLRKYRSEKRDTGTIIFIALALAIIMMVWAGGQLPPFTWLYARIPLLAEFRYVGRALALAGLWWIALGGIAIDLLWNCIGAGLRVPPQFEIYDRLRLLRGIGIAGVVWLYMLIYSLAPLPTRLSMTFRNLQAWQRLDGLRFTSVLQAVEGLLTLVLVALIIDSLLLLVERIILVLLSPTRLDKFGLTWLALSSRMLRLPLLMVILIGTWDVMRSNAPAMQFVQVSDPFSSIFEVIPELDTETPFPAVKLPFTARSFSAYESQVRNWALNEGWLPAAPVGLLKDGQTINNLPRWGVIVRDEQGSIPVERDLQFLEEAGYQLQGCYLAGSSIRGECRNLPDEIALYEYRLALPYAFVITRDHLMEQAASVNASTVHAVTVISHQLDTIIIRAEGTEIENSFLVVQESNFPGWQATVDGNELAISTAQTGYKDEQQLGLIVVPLLPGEHTYTFTFEPPGFSTGVIVFSVTVMAVMVYLYRGRNDETR
jgi:hypothetical protein